MFLLQKYDTSFWHVCLTKAYNFNTTTSAERKQEVCNFFAQPAERALRLLTFAAEGSTQTCRTNTWGSKVQPSQQQQNSNHEDPCDFSLAMLRWITH